MKKKTSPDDKFFGKDTEEWKWSSFTSTKGFPVSTKLIDWIIGQDKAIKETKLCIDEWVHKLKWLKEKQWWKAFEIVEKTKKDVYIKLFGRKYHLFSYKKKTYSFNPKSQPKEYLPAGPFLALFGDAGTGKSLLGRAMSGYMTDLYKNEDIKLYDVCAWRNKILPSEPRISIHPSPEGSVLIKKVAKIEAKKGRWIKWGLKAIIGLALGFGSIILGYFAYIGLSEWIDNPLIIYHGAIQKLQIAYVNIINWAISGVIIPNVQFIMAGVMAIVMGGMLYFFARMFGGMGGNKKGTGGAESTQAPKLLIDNSSGNAPFIDATGHGSSQLFGSIAWDPYQTGDLGTPEHQRVSVGDVHRAHLGILYIDEVKNLTGAEAITLLTVLEDGQLPVALRSQFHGGDTAAMAVATEPIPSMNFLIIAGNMDSLPYINAALMDRIRGYGKVVYMNNDIENNVENRRNYVQFISQEVQRFHLLPFNRKACIAIIDEARKKSGYADRLVTKFRPMISVIKTAGILALKEGVDIIDEKHIKCAIEEHCKSVSTQYLESHMEEIIRYKSINPKSKPIIGFINGLAVITSGDEEQMGTILQIKASYKKSRSPKDIIVTGVNTVDSSWVQNSIKKISSLIDIPKGKTLYIDFMQSIGIDGPSAGVAMTLVSKSILFNKKIRQDVTVTGEINLSSKDGKILVTPIGGVHAKIMAAQMTGFTTICIPKKNYDININPKDYKIRIVPCETLKDYEREVFT